MAKKMTHPQIASLARINAGWPEAALNNAPGVAVPDAGCLILSNHSCMDPDGQVRCHRTIKTTTPAGSQVQSFRIAKDGTVERKL